MCGSACHLVADSQRSAFVFTSFTPLTEGASLALCDMKGSDPELVLHAVRDLHKGQGYGCGSKAQRSISGTVEAFFYYRSVPVYTLWYIIAFRAVTDGAT